MLALAACAAVPGPALAWERLSGRFSGVREARTAWVRSQADWERLWTEHCSGARADPPKVDFSREMVVAVFLGVRRSGGAAVSVDVSEAQADAPRAPGERKSRRFVVRWREEGPAPGSFSLPVMSSPFEMRKVAASDGVVVFEAAPPGGGAAAPVEPSGEESSAGLSSARRRLLRGFSAGGLPSPRLFDGR